MHGVPWDKAEAMDDVERFAWYVMAGEFDGGQFDWDTMSWKAPKSDA